MKHNTDLENAEFELNYNKTNLLYLLNDENPNQEKIEIVKKRIAETEERIQFLKT